VGDCHYVSGNHRTAKRLPLYKRFLEFAGIEPERLCLKWVSASEGTIFAEVVKEFTETLRAMPPMKERLKHSNAGARVGSAPATQERAG
jgi:F420-non-reducing hydrogenase iron-sulfur subunit